MSKKAEKQRKPAALPLDEIRKGEALLLQAGKEQAQKVLETHEKALRELQEKTKRKEKLRARATADVARYRAMIERPEKKAVEALETAVRALVKDPKNAELRKAYMEALRAIPQSKQPEVMARISREVTGGR